MLPWPSFWTSFHCGQYLLYHPTGSCGQSYHCDQSYHQTQRFSTCSLFQKHQVTQESHGTKPLQWVWIHVSGWCHVCLSLLDCTLVTQTTVLEQQWPQECLPLVSQRRSLQSLQGIRIQRDFEHYVSICSCHFKNVTFISKTLNVSPLNTKASYLYEWWDQIVLHKWMLPCCDLLQ